MNIHSHAPPLCYHYFCNVSTALKVPHEFMPWVFYINVVYKLYLVDPVAMVMGVYLDDFKSLTLSAFRA